jgi:hypothetical protein
MSFPAFIYQEKDVELSLRDFLLNEPIRQVDPDLPNLSLPDLYPSMSDDADQYGVRIADLYDEQNPPCFPVFGLFCKELNNYKTGVGGLKHYYYSFFVDAVCRVDDDSGGLDKQATSLQRMTVFSDLRYLFLEGRSRNTPFYTYNETDDTKTLVGTFGITRQPRPRLINTSAKVANCLCVNADFVVEVILSDQRGA